MNRAHRIRLEPTPEQAYLFSRHAGYARAAYNWAVAEFRAALSIGEWLWDRDLRPRWNRVKRILRPWCDELSQNPAKGAVMDAGVAIVNWNRYRQIRKEGITTGPEVGPPRRKKRKSRPSFRADNGSGTVKFDGKTMLLPAKLGGAVLMRERLRWPDARIVEVRISRRAGHWHASVIMDDGLPLPPVVDNGKPELGIDLGLKTLASCSDGVKYEGPKALRNALKRLRRENKKLARMVEGSRNWHQQVAAIGRLHAGIADLRSDYAHKTTTAIVARAGAVRVETLNIKGLMRNRRLSRAFADAGMAELIRQLEYKCAWAGIFFERIDRWYPSSQLCNCCGWRNDGLKLVQRDWQCGGCGCWLDRDVNAARNVRDYGRELPVSACGDCVRPAGTPAVVVEAGSGVREGAAVVWPVQLRLV